ncbi:hypothetical protein [Sedimentitalea nanhaiensis]|uniref:hypothetical protein n=1 Tax=Sedimentitalea nanhaiensis TaxID=999627 RepID=UPI00055EB026|nr:hypothetical protein [Sedimentitalea nanhaiensis]
MAGSAARTRRRSWRHGAVPAAQWQTDRTSPAMGAAPLDLYDYVPAAGSRNTRERRSAPQRIRITDDWPEIVPITEAEVRIVEAYFGDVLDELFGPLP